MGSLLETSVIVRYLVNDEPVLAARARGVIDDAPDLFVPTVVLAETAFVLFSVYKISRTIIVDHLVQLLRKSNVRALGIEKTLAIQALMLCRPSGRISFADALTWAHARASGFETIYTFDARFPSEGVELRSAV